MVDSCALATNAKEIMKRARAPAMKIMEYRESVCAILFKRILIAGEGVGLGELVGRCLGGIRNLRTNIGARIYLRYLVRALHSEVQIESGTKHNDDHHTPKKRQIEALRRFHTPIVAPCLPPQGAIHHHSL